MKHNLLFPILFLSTLGAYIWAESTSLDPINEGGNTYYITINTGVSSTNPNEVSVTAEGTQDPSQKSNIKEQEEKSNNGYGTVIETGVKTVIAIASLLSIVYRPF